MTALLEIESLCKRFPLGHGRELHAVNDVSLTVEQGESLGLVGESGSGKTTTGRCILHLLQPTSGTIRFDGRDVSTLRGNELRRLRADMRVVFQEPFESLNPRHRVRDIVGEPLLLHRPGLTRAERRRRVLELLERVQLAPQLAARRPGQLSGGQQQRVGIARAIATDPKFVVLDEPTSALDVSVRAQILELLLELQREQGFSYLFISHDLSTVQYSCGQIAVMYLGRIVEVGSPDDVYERPRHPYTGALLSAVPVPRASERTRVRSRVVLAGDVPSPVNPPRACRFHTRCPKAQELCAQVDPPLERKDESPRRAACHFPLTDEEGASMTARWAARQRARRA